MRRIITATIVAAALLLSVHPVGADPDEAYPAAYIVGGGDTTTDIWPSMVALVFETTDGLRQGCGGTLIRADLVVTAAHCTEHFLNNPSDLEVLLGRSDLNSLDGEFIEVASIIQHPDYVPEPYFVADISLLRLARPSSRAVTPLVTAADEPDWATHPHAVVAGWGQTTAGAVPTNGLLRHLDVTIASDDHCRERPTFRSGWDLCGGAVAGSACYGDSGGPLVTEAGGQRRLAGVISRGAEKCDGDSIYVRMAAYADWIFTSTQSPNTTRRSGPDRYLTAANLAADFEPGAPVAYLVTGQQFPDAVTAAAAAGAAGGPVLLTQRDQLPAATRNELARLKPGRLVVVGGPGAVSDAVANDAAAAAGVPASRLFGPDRYRTAVAISTDAHPLGSDTVFVAVGTAFPDAVASGAVAGAPGGGPVLLTEKSSLPNAVAEELARLSPSRVVILGGTGAVGPEVQAAIAAAVPAATIQRLSGADRYSTAAAISAAAFAPGVPVVYVATGKAFPDALASGPVAVAADAPILLVDGPTVPAAVAAEIKRLAPERIVVLGGSAAVSAHTAWHLDGLLVG